MNKGFTLIELLVVIAIIGILMSLGMYGFTHAQKATRDTQRKNDLRQYQIALENYANANNGVYPTHTGEVSGLCSALGSYLSSCPNEPISSSYYSYQGSATDYTLWADLENGPFWLVSSSGRAEETGSVPGGASPTPTPTPTPTSPPGATPTPTPAATPTPTPTPGTPAWDSCFTTSTLTCTTFCSSLIPVKTAINGCTFGGYLQCTLFYSDAACNTLGYQGSSCDSKLEDWGSGSAKCCCQ